jgi:1,4-alpha-glucan branching enzyme
VVLEDGNWMERNPIWSHYLIQNKENMILENIFWNPEIKYKWKYPKKHMEKPKSLRIYEAHIGLSSFDPKINTYKEFAENILPRVKKMGYTAIQFMAIMEHANYASFGFHVNYLFAISSRFGTPEEFMYLVDKCHESGLFVIMDIIHSHASSNVNDGFNYWDGTDHLYFHGGDLGKHIQFNSKLYNYSSYETLRLLLSNCAYYINEYRIDGFRFDCVTSMLYTHHGIDYNFTGDYKLYFSECVNEESSVYLMLANTLIHKLNPEAITIAEDFSGMPGLSRPVEEGGFGFDYNVNMKMCDKWKEFLMNLKDEEWNMGNIIYNLTNRRYNEKQISYCESHDQSFVGNYSLSALLFSSERFWNMSKNSPETIVIYRGICLHKLIRLLTFALGGEGYLSFMGNEFACPDSLDFPKKENRFSYSHCRRRWDLCDDKELRYSYLYNWEIIMNILQDIFNFKESKEEYISTKHEDDKVIVFEKGDLLFAFNLHPVKSFEGYQIGTKWGTKHRIILDSDEERFMGKGRLNHGHNNSFPVSKKSFNNRPYNMKVYIPSRTCMVLIAEENLKKYDISKLDINFDEV